MEELTKRQREVIEFIVQYTFEHLYQPTLREIGQACQIASTNGISDHIKALRRKGYLEESKANMRSFGLTDRALRLVKENGKLRARPIVAREEDDAFSGY